MVAKVPKTSKQLMAENLWLHYYNDVLVREGLITQRDYERMIHRINCRTKTVKQEDKEYEKFPQRSAPSSDLCNSLER